jgi:replicative DNA helicase
MIVDHEAETHVLAGLLLSDKLLYDGLAALTESHFWYLEQREVYNYIAKVSGQGRPTWNIVYKELRNSVPADNLLAIKNAVITEDAFSYWFDKLHENFIKRSYWQAAQDIRAICESDRPVKEITEIVEQRIMRVHIQETTDEIITPEEGAQRAAEEFERRQNSSERIHGIKLSRPVATGGVPSTDGFPGLDEMFRGLRGGDLVIVAARTGDGKTALAQNIVRHASVHQQYRTFYQNTEMKPEEIIFRFVSGMSGVSFEGIDGGGLNSWDRTLARQMFDKYAESRIYISELPMLTPERSRGLARQFKMKFGQIDLLVIDYIGRMELENSKGKQEWQVLRDIAKECKRLAQELNAAVMLISQLTEEGKLQGAKAIANEADGVLYLEPLEKDEINEAPRGATHKITSAKARRGVKGKKLWISFNKDKMYMTEVV